MIGKRRGWYETRIARRAVSAGAASRVPCRAAGTHVYARGHPYARPCAGPERRWITFSQLYEPVVIQNLACRKDREQWAEFLNSAAYTTNLSADMELAVLIRFDILNGPSLTTVLFTRASATRFKLKSCRRIFMMNSIGRSTCLKPQQRTAL